MPDSLAVLIVALGTAGPSDRAQAAEKLAHLGEAAQPAAVQLVTACGDETEEVREWAVAALEELGPSRREDLEKLAHLAAHGSDDQAYWACTLLGRAAADAAGFSEVLREIAAGHESAEVRRRAQWAIEKIDAG
jgi:HEAT repeat protein